VLRIVGFQAGSSYNPELLQNVANLLTDIPLPEFPLFRVCYLLFQPAKIELIFINFFIAELPFTVC
jgi:hypothetical protein